MITRLGNCRRRCIIEMLSRSSKASSRRLLPVCAPLAAACGLLLTRVLTEQSEKPVESALKLKGREKKLRKVALFLGRLSSARKAAGVLSWAGKDLTCQILLSQFLSRTMTPKLPLIKFLWMYSSRHCVFFPFSLFSLLPYFRISLQARWETVR